MINKLLHALANRKGPLDDPLLLLEPGFAPADLAFPVQQLRGLFLLDVPTDYYLKTYLCCLEAYPDIRQLADDPVVTFKASDFPPAGISIDGGDFQSKINVVGYFNDQETTKLPLTLTYRVRYHDSWNVRIDGIETGLVRIAAFIRSGTAPHEMLRIQWPTDIPFTGPIVLNQDWLPGAVVEIKVEPSRFPFVDLVQRLRGNALLMSWLAEAHLVDEYVATTDAHRQTALAVLMLATNNPAVYPNAD